MEPRYVVVEEWADGLTQAWGPFSERRASMAQDALRAAEGGVREVYILPVYTSGQLDRELPDWKRDARV